jgi:hypothetical protein
MMVGVVGILFTNPVYADLSLTGALIGIGIAGFAHAMRNELLSGSE